MKCDRCGSDAAVFVRHSGAHLCPGHFTAYVERKIKKEVRRQVRLSRGEKIAVAVSGGKDSMVALSVLNDLFGERNGISVECVTVDEGIDGYRPGSIDVVRGFCSGKGIPLRVLSFEETYGLTLDEMVPHAGEKTPCTYCGVFRRKCLNILAHEAGADYVATGHNLDDMSQSVMMNFVRGDVARLARLGPHSTPIEGMVPRLMPLRTVLEKESVLYAMFSGIPFHDGRCPYWEAALRNQYREVVDSLDDKTPGIKFSILSSYDTLYPLIKGGGTVDTNVCACGERCIGEECQACVLLAQLRERVRNP
ncbi:MAG: TIGR00269 family protein [Thermoplasmatales archaeon]|nr:TIGR00269 family protein [Thermoplasmatales archaeon]